MFALFIVMNKTKYLDEILSNFVKVGVRGATIVDSQGMAGAMADADTMPPVFGGLLKGVIENAKPCNKTIITVLETQELVDQVVATVKQTLGNDAKEGAGFMFSVPLGNVYRFDQ